MALNYAHVMLGAVVGPQNLHFAPLVVRTEHTNVLFGFSVYICMLHMYIYMNIYIHIYIYIELAFRNPRCSDRTHKCALWFFCIHIYVIYLHIYEYKHTCIYLELAFRTPRCSDRAHKRALWFFCINMYVTYVHIYGYIHTYIYIYRTYIWHPSLFGQSTQMCSLVFLYKYVCIYIGRACTRAVWFLENMHRYICIQIHMYK